MRGISEYNGATGDELALAIRREFGLGEATKETRDAH